METFTHIERNSSIIINGSSMFRSSHTRVHASRNHHDDEHRPYIEDCERGVKGGPNTYERKICVCMSVWVSGALCVCVCENYRLKTSNGEEPSGREEEEDSSLRGLSRCEHSIVNN